MADSVPIRMPPRQFKTPLCNLSCKWSPVDPTKLVLASAQNYGMLGNGAVTLLNINNAGIQIAQTYQTPDATFDVCFNEANPNQLLSAGGDGMLRLWDVA